MATTRRRKVLHETEALSLLEELERSGLTLSRFCVERGVDGRSLNCWKQNLDRSGQAKRMKEPPFRLVELVSANTETIPHAAYTIRVGGVHIDVDDHFRDETLARLLRVAATC